MSPSLPASQHELHGTPSIRDSDNKTHHTSHSSIHFCCNETDDNTAPSKSCFKIIPEIFRDCHIKSLVSIAENNHSNIFVRVESSNHEEEIHKDVDEQEEK